MTFNLTESWAIRAGRQYSVRDLWSTLSLFGDSSDVIYVS
jgi:hypothetical protein